MTSSGKARCSWTRKSGDCNESETQIRALLNDVDDGRADFSRKIADGIEPHFAALLFSLSPCCASRLLSSIELL